MSIIYSVICRQGAGQSSLVNLVSYDAAHGNYPAITNEIISNIKITDSITYRYNQDYNYHILKDGCLIFVGLADSSMKIRTVFAFLQEVRRLFREKYSNQQVTLARSYEMSASFSDIYRNQVILFNSNREQDKKEILMKQLTQLQEIMSENIDKVLQREQKVQIIVKKTAKIDNIAQEIKKNASNIKKQAFLSKNKWKIFTGALAVIAVCGFIVLI